VSISFLCDFARNRDVHAKSQRKEILKARRVEHEIFEAAFAV
jgi:hypothetical protein